MDYWNDIIDKIKALIDENIECIPSLSEISKQLGYSKFHLTRKFHEIVGISYREYITTRKMKFASLDIYNTRDKIIDIAMKYHYSSHEAFDRTFYKYYNISPTSYRRLLKPTACAVKVDVIGFKGTLKSQSKTKGAKNMKIYIKQMFDWNCYAYYVENVDEKYWEFFRTELWWKIGDSFIKQYDNVNDFKYCADNFTKYGELSIKQQLKMEPTPWETALNDFIKEAKKLDVDWYVHGSAAMALCEIDVTPKDINIIFPNYSDFDIVRNHFCKYAISPIERCDNWVMSGLGSIFMNASISLAFHNKEHEPYNMKTLNKIDYNGDYIYTSTLEMLKHDNESMNRYDRVEMIQQKLR